MAIRHTTEKFIEKAIKRHGNKYLYDKTEYVHSHSKVIVTCPEHGDFMIQAAAHTNCQAHGCRACRDDSRRHSLESWTALATERHGGAYDYSMAEYVSNRSKVKIICRKHGTVFEQSAQSHLAGQGCPICARERTTAASKDSKEDFLRKAHAAHGGRYDYSEADYTYSNVKLKIICSKHGAFMQAPAPHVKGHGCPSCGEYGFQPGKPGWLYVMSSPSTVKVGICNRHPNKRAEDVTASSGGVHEVVVAYHFADGSHAASLENILLAMLRANWKHPENKYDGYTESFVGLSVSDVLKVVDGLLNSLSLHNQRYLETIGETI